MKNSVVLGLGQDAKDDVLLVRMRATMWKLPSEFRDRLPSGVKQVIPGKPGSKGPWVGERLLGTGELGSAGDAPALAAATLKILKNNCGGQRIPQEIKDKFLFWTADNAADESCAHDSVRAELQNLTFDDPDDTHSVMLAIKNGCAGDPEVELVQQVMLTNLPISAPLKASATCFNIPPVSAVTTRKNT